MLPFLGSGQNYLWEIGIGAGATGYVGEIGGSLKTQDWGPADVAFKATRLSASAFGRRLISYRFYANFQLSYIWLHADDKYAIGTGREFRNQSFTNQMWEGLTMVEYHPIIISDLGGRKRYKADLHVFFSSGAGVIYHNPKAIINNQKVTLLPLHTEGPNKSYSQFQLVVPVAIGTFVSFQGKGKSYKIARKNSGKGYKVNRIGITLNYRYTYFDYLDDMSTTYPDISVFNGNQTAINASHRAYSSKTGEPTPYPKKGTLRGSSGANDHYFTAMIYYSRRINSGKTKSKISSRQENFRKAKKKRK